MRKRLILIAPFLAAALLLTANLASCYTNSIERHFVSYYNHGTVTASGEPFVKTNFTCAVREYDDMGHWYVFTYQNRSVYCWANDVMPRSSNAEYDLSEGAFAKLAPLKAGMVRMHVREVQ